MKDANRTRRTSHGSFIVDGRTTVLGFDQAMEALTGWPAIEIVGQAGALFDREPITEAWSSNRELSLHCRDGRKLDVEVSARTLQGPGSRTLVTVLQVLASSPDATPAPMQGQDALTGLGDHETFAAELSREFGLATASASPLSVILLDVDHLREVNDRSGRLAGDEVLRKIAGILRVSADGDARIARLSGDDFAVLLVGGGRGEARQFAASLRSTIERFRFFPTHDVARKSITVSLGTASYPADADNETELMARGREALDEARSMGRNRVWCYLRRPRVPLQVPVYFDAVDPLLVGYARDLSPSGIFVQTTEGIDVGMRCALAFPLPGYDGKVHVVGRVVRTVLPDTSADAELRIPGLGVEFERFGGASDRRAIETFLHGREANSLRPENGRLSV